MSHFLSFHLFTFSPSKGVSHLFTFSPFHLYWVLVIFSPFHLFTFTGRQPSFHFFTFSPLLGVSHIFTFSLFHLYWASAIFSLFHSFTFSPLQFPSNFRISVNPSRKGRITFSTRGSVATRSLKRRMPRVCWSLS